MKIDYDSIESLTLEYTCDGISAWKWEELMEGHVRANHKKINSLVKKLLPELWEDLCLEFHNPYNYFRTKTHLVLVHSCVEHFIKFS